MLSYKSVLDLSSNFLIKKVREHKIKNQLDNGHNGHCKSCIDIINTVDFELGLFLHEWKPNLM